MKNYVDLGKTATKRWERYLYLDTEDILLFSLVNRYHIRLKCETIMRKGNDKYLLIQLKVLKKHQELFLKAMEELKAKMLLCGHVDYESHGDELITELESVFRQEMKEYGRVLLHKGGYVKPELGAL